MRLLLSNLVAAGVILFTGDFIWARSSQLPLSVDNWLPTSQAAQEKERLATELVHQNQRLHHELQLAEDRIKSADATIAAVIAAATTPAALIPAASSADPGPYAYSFYATSDDYACGVLVNIHRLRDLLHSRLPIHVLVSTAVSESYTAAFRAAGAVVHLEEPPPIAEGGGYYQDCLLKLLAFKLHRLSPGLKRVLAFDSDQLIMRNLDSLFEGLPDVDLAAPRAYWLARDFLASTFLMIGLSDRLWETVQGAIMPSGELGGARVGMFDMDIMNELLGNTVTMLSGEYVALNSHWEDWNLPNWYHSSSTELNLTTVEMVNDIIREKNSHGDLDDPNRRRSAEQQDSGAVRRQDEKQQEDGGMDAGLESGSSTIVIEGEEAAIENEDPPNIDSVALIGSLAEQLQAAEAEHLATSEIIDASDLPPVVPARLPPHGAYTAPAVDAILAFPSIPAAEQHTTPTFAAWNEPFPPPVVVVQAPEPEPTPRFPASHPISQELYRLQDAAAVIHFSALGKPWTFTGDMVKMARPDAHPLLGEQFRVWREAAEAFCPHLGKGRGRSR